MPTGLLLSDDLIFSSRITATARAAGVAVKAVRGADQLLALAEKEGPSCVIVDLANPTLQIADFIRRLHESATPRPRVVAYGSHVDTATLRAAREAGCDLVLPRSKFVEDLSRELPAWMNQNAGTP